MTVPAMFLTKNTIEVWALVFCLGIDEWPAVQIGHGSCWGPQLSRSLGDSLVISESYPVSMSSYPLQGFMMSSGLGTSWIQAGKAVCGLGRDTGEWVESERDYWSCFLKHLPSSWRSSESTCGSTYLGSRHRRIISV